MRHLLYFLSFILLCLFANQVFAEAQQHSYPRINLATGEIRNQNARQVYLGEKCDIYLFEDIEQQSRKQNKNILEDLKRLGKEFDEYIYPGVTSIIADIGSPATKTTLLIDDIQDKSFHEGRSIGKQYKGYYSPTELGQNIILLDINYSWQGIGSLYAQTVHEFFHLIHYLYDRNEEDWVNEGLALLFERFLYNTVHHSSIIQFLNEPNNSLTHFENRSNKDYAFSYLFFAYLSDHFGGVNTIAQIIKNSGQGIQGIESALSDMSLSLNDIPIDFNFIFRHFALALYFNTTAFSEFDLFSMRGSTAYRAHTVLFMQKFEILPYSFVIIEMPRNFDQKISFKTEASLRNNEQIDLYVYNLTHLTNSSITLDNITEGSEFMLKKLDNNIERAVIVVINSSPESAHVSFNFEQ